MIKHNKGNLYNYKNLFTNSSNKFFSLKKKKSFTSTKHSKKDMRITVLVKDKEELNMINKEQKETIAKLLNEAEMKEKKYNELTEMSQRLNENINKIKYNQSQLVMLIKLLEEKGIDVEGIINKWNEQVDKANINKDIFIVFEKNISSVL